MSTHRMARLRKTASLVLNIDRCGGTLTQRETPPIEIVLGILM
jgi:hypothetical protein